MKKLIVLGLLTGVAIARGQATPDSSASSSPQPNLRNGILTSLASDFFSGDFLNVFGYVNAVYDSTQLTLQNKGRAGGAGFSVGGGITGSKEFSDGALSVNYRGDFRDYRSGLLGSGTNQYLSLIYTKRIGRRWTISLNESAGILFYSNSYFSSLAGSGGGVQTNPFSPTTRFVQSSADVTYHQTQRLYYTLGGNFYLSRYSYAGAVGTTGGIFSASASYVLTPRTTIGLTYSHDNFYFQRGFGTTNIDGGFGNVSHVFGRGWDVNLSAGVTRAHTAGEITLPVQVILGGQTVTGYEIGKYSTTSYVPTLGASLSRHIGKFSLTASLSRGVNPGNGTYLTSTHTSFGGIVSRAYGRSAVLSFNSFFSQLSSIANNVSHGYTQYYTTVNYSRTLLPHVSMFVSYSYDRYGSLLAYGSSSDNRFTGGLSFSSKNIPLTPF